MVCGHQLDAERNPFAQTNMAHLCLITGLFVLTQTLGKPSKTAMLVFHY